MGRLNEIFDIITYYNKEISYAKKQAEKMRKASYNSKNKITDSYFTLIMKQIDKTINNYESKKRIYEKKFIDAFYDRFKTRCEFKNDKIAFDLQTEENKYQQDIEKFKDGLLNGEFNSKGEITIINHNYDDILNVIKTLELIINTGYDYKKTSYFDFENELFMMRINNFVDKESLGREFRAYNRLLQTYNDFYDLLEKRGERPSKQTLDYLINNTSLIGLVCANNVSKVRGKNVLDNTFLCQFHDKKTPFMHVSIDKNRFDCYGCENCHNQIDYLMKKENLTYDDAVYLLAEIYLVDIPSNPFKDKAYSSLVRKYQSSLTSDKYHRFLEESYVSGRDKFVDADETFSKLFSEIERIKLKKNDSSFTNAKK